MPEDTCLVQDPFFSHHPCDRVRDMLGSLFGNHFADREVDGLLFGLRHHLADRVLGSLSRRIIPFGSGFMHWRHLRVMNGLGALFVNGLGHGVVDRFLTLFSNWPRHEIGRRFRGRDSGARRRHLHGSSFIASVPNPAEDDQGERRCNKCDAVRFADSHGLFLAFGIAIHRFIDKWDRLGEEHFGRWCDFGNVPDWSGQSRFF